MEHWIKKAIEQQSRTQSARNALIEAKEIVKNEGWIKRPFLFVECKSAAIAGRIPLNEKIIKAITNGENYE